MIIYLIRHGESEANISNIFQGQLDTDLSENGKNQIIKIGKRFENIDDFEVIYISPLKWAKLTAMEIYKYHKNKKIIEDDRLKERSHGDFTGLENKGQYDELEEKCHFKRKAPNGENFYDQFKRVEEFIKEVMKLGKNCVIVSHGGTMRCILNLFSLYSKEELTQNKSIHPKNTSLYKFTLNGEQVEILLENCIKHLEE